MKKLILSVALFVGATYGFAQATESGLMGDEKSDFSMRIQRSEWLLPKSAFLKKDYLKIDKNRIEMSPSLTTYLKRMANQRERDLYKIGLTPEQVNAVLNKKLTAVR